MCVVHTESCCGGIKRALGIIMCKHGALARVCARLTVLVAGKTVCVCIQYICTIVYTAMYDKWCSVNLFSACVCCGRPFARAGLTCVYIYNYYTTRCVCDVREYVHDTRRATSEPLPLPLLMMMHPIGIFGMRRK